VKKVVGSSTTHYVWEGWQVIAEHNGSTGAVVTEYVYAGGRMIAREQGGRVFFLQDRLSIRAMITDGQGGIQGRQAHLPFGEELGTSGTQDKHRFTTYERETETGTDYAVNRQYGVNAARFMRADPSHGSYRLFPQSLNRYAYVQNSPVDLVDPLGLDLSSSVRYPGWLLCIVLPWLCEPILPTKPTRDPEGRGGSSVGLGPQPKPGETCKDYISEFTGLLSPFDFKLAEAVFIEYSGDDQEGLAIAHVIWNRIWYLRQPEVPDTRTLDAFGARERPMSVKTSPCEVGTLEAMRTQVSCD
jgi:RHS repeat-associated protein